MQNYLENRLLANKHAFFQRVQTEQFLTLLKRAPYEKVLEVGIGRGFWSYVGAKHKKFKKIWGCDAGGNFVSQELVKLDEFVNFEKIGGKKLPFKSGFFDLVFSMDVIEHAQDDMKLIKEHIRVCKKGGEVIIGTPNKNRAANMILKLMGKLKYPMNLGKDYYGDCVHVREYTIRELKNIMRSFNATVYPCWIGILPLNLGLARLKGFLNNFCQFFFVKIKKI